MKLQSLKFTGAGVATFCAVSTVFFATAAAGATSAGDTKIKPVTSFGYLDANSDGRVSRDEAKADWAVAQGFARADANGDGYLDKKEFDSLSRV